MNKYTKSKTSLVLMELILTILLFAICGAICMKLFAAADSLSKKTRELNKAVACAQGYVEVMRGTDGTLDNIMGYYPDAVKSDDTFFQVYYDRNFNTCAYSEATYISDVALVSNGAIQNIDVKIVRLSNHDEIYSLSASKYIGDNIIKD